MRYIKYFLLFVIALLLITIFFANRQVVSLTVLPSVLEEFIGINALVGPIQLPLYAVVLGGVGVGLVLGYILEWLREHKHRRDASVGRQTKAELETEVKKLKAQKNAGKDPVLVMVEEATAR